MNVAFLTRAALAVAVLTSPALSSAQTSEKGKKMNDIVAVAANAGQFNTLIAAVKAAGLVETLQGAGPFTVFAPTDAAFARLPKGTIEALLNDKENLTAILTYHVVSGKVMAADIIKSGGAEPATINGAEVSVTIRDGKVYVDGAQVTAADIQASNGVIHVIDAVMMPPVAAGASR